MVPPNQDIVIFTDEPGWHGRVLRRALQAQGLAVHFVSLCECEFDLASAEPRIVIPGLSAPPRAAFVRGVAGGTLEEIVQRLNVLHGLAELGIAVYNNGRAIERTVDKSLTSFLLRANGVPTPRTWVMESADAAHQLGEREFAEGHSLVLKPLFGSQGNGVVRLDSRQDIVQYAPDSGVYYLQEYIDSGTEDYRDWRVFVIAGRAVAAMQRRSQHWVTNRAQGAVCEPIRFDRQLNALAEAATSAVDVDYAGVDLLRDSAGHWLVSEVNGIPAWQGLQRATGTAVTQLLTEAFMAKLTSTTEVAAAG